MLLVWDVAENTRRRINSTLKTLSFVIALFLYIYIVIIKDQIIPLQKEVERRELAKPERVLAGTRGWSLHIVGGRSLHIAGGRSLHIPAIAC